MTLIFSALTASVSMTLNLPHPGLLLTLAGYFGLLFATTKFHANIADKQDDNHYSWLMGMELYHLLEARKAIPSLRLLERYRIPYRDDNQIVWHFEDVSWQDSVEYMVTSQR